MITILPKIFGMAVEVNVLETKENTILTSDAAPSEAPAYKLNTFEKFYENVALVYVQREKRKIEEETEYGKDAKETETEEKELREKLFHHLG